MQFFADKQTIEDLNLLGTFRNNSIFSMYNKVITAGGRRLLEAFFRQPLSSAAAINKRAATISYIQQLRVQLPIGPEQFLVAEEYLSGAAPSSYLLITAMVFRKKLAAIFLRDEQFDMLRAGVYMTTRLLHRMRTFVNTLPIDADNPCSEQIGELRLLLFDPRLDFVEKDLPAVISVWQVARLDRLLRHQLLANMEKLLHCMYEWDVYISVGQVARERNFSFAHAVQQPAAAIQASAIWHPAIQQAVPNAIHLEYAHSLLFLTGANMAGKSTLMKSLGIAVYLAHIGFPVAAKDMVFSVMDGLYTSINISDNLDRGYSHFYAEVLRVKQAAELVSSGKKMLVIFDELFKGTNVKDAYDATLAITRSFAAYHNCCFVLSTHIVEVGSMLQQTPGVQFAFLPTIMKGRKPQYTYLLREGISADRQGMLIIENENILDLLRPGEHDTRA